MLWHVKVRKQANKIATKKYFGLKAGGIGVLSLHFMAICPMMLLNGIYFGLVEGYATTLIAENYMRPEINSRLLNTSSKLET